MTNIVDVFFFSGTPYEIGYQNGKTRAEFLKKYLKGLSFGNLYETKSWPSPEDYNIENFKEKQPADFARWDKFVKSQPEWILEELHGLADGAGVEYEKVLIDIKHFPLMFSSASKGAAGDDDCNGFVVYGKGAVGGKPIVGGNAEGASEPRRVADIDPLSGHSRTAIYYVKNNKMNSLVFGHGCPGQMCAHGGINEKGLAMFGSGVSAKSEDLGDVGMPALMTRRVALQTCNNVDEAIDFYKNIPKLGSSHVYIADLKRAVMLEFTGKHMAVSDPERGFIGGASPAFVNPTMKPYHSCLIDETDPRFNYTIALKRGEFRHQRYVELFEKKKPLNPEMCMELLGDHGGRGAGIVREEIYGAPPQGSDYTICPHGSGNPEHGFHKIGTSYIIVPDRKTMYVAFGSPCQANYVPFKVP